MVLVVIQAKMGSKRLPGKSLMEISHKPMLELIIDRVSKSELSDDMVIATTLDDKDDIIQEMCENKNIKCHRSKIGDVLSQFCSIVDQYKPNFVVRITADCPLIEVEIVDSCIDLCVKENKDYVSNLLPRTYPRGLDVEVVKSGILKKLDYLDKEYREHVTLYLRKNPDDFNIGNVSNDIDYSYMRWTVDTMEDLIFVRKVYNSFKKEFNYREVIELLKYHPDWVINDTSPILEAKIK